MHIWIIKKQKLKKKKKKNRLSISWMLMGVIFLCGTSYFIPNLQIISPLAIPYANLLSSVRNLVSHIPKYFLTYSTLQYTQNGCRIVIPNTTSTNKLANFKIPYQGHPMR
jgi:hypothetical protein